MANVNMHRLALLVSINVVAISFLLVRGNRLPEHFNFCALSKVMGTLLNCTDPRMPRKSYEIFNRRAASVPGMTREELIDTVCTLHNNAGHTLWKEMSAELPSNELPIVENEIYQCMVELGYHQ